MTKPQDLRMNQVVRVEYRKTNGTVGGYHGTVDEIRDASVLVKLFREPGTLKNEFRTFNFAQITSLIVG